ncbi:MAG TPA: hypothetical protein PLD86_00330 [Vicinamibacteria bacterium]|nr:hypothetical protein [Vicinamibacteria bacterium]
MTNRLTLALGIGLWAAFALATPSQSQTGATDTKAASAKAPPMAGTVMSINGVKVEVEVTGEKPAWVKKGGGIKLAEVKGGVGKIVDVSATTVVFNSKKASELKVGDKVTLEKGPAAPAGC